MVGLFELKGPGLPNPFHIKALAEYNLSLALGDKETLQVTNCLEPPAPGGFTQTPWVLKESIKTYTYSHVKLCLSVSWTGDLAV